MPRRQSPAAPQRSRHRHRFTSPPPTNPTRQVVRRAGIAFIGSGLVTAAMVGAKACTPGVGVEPQQVHDPSASSSRAAEVGIVGLRRMAEGQYLGTAFRNPYGLVQVAITIRGGQLVDVAPVQLPTAAARGIEIGRRATPVLRAQAIERQSADIDTVTGATYTSDGYRKSLQSAIDAAHAGRRWR